MFLCQVKDLQGPRLGFERNDLLVPVHDSAIGLDWPLGDLIVVLEVNDDDFGIARALGVLLSDTDIVVGFKRLRTINIDSPRPLMSVKLTHELKPIDAG